MVLGLFRQRRARVKVLTHLGHLLGFQRRGAVKGQHVSRRRNALERVEEGQVASLVQPASPGAAKPLPERLRLGRRYRMRLVLSGIGPAPDRVLALLDRNRMTTRRLPQEAGILRAEGIGVALQVVEDRIAEPLFHHLRCGAGVGLDRAGSSQIFSVAAQMLVIAADHFNPCQAPQAELRKALLRR